MILEQLQRDLLAASEREQRRSRRLPVLLPLTAAVAAVAVAVLLVRGTEPERELSAPRPERVTLTVPGVSPPVSFIASTDASGRLCERVEHDPLPHAGCIGGFDLGKDFFRLGGPAHFHVTRYGNRWVVTGVARRSAREVRVLAPGGRRAAATLSSRILRVPVRIPPGPGLSAEGRRLARALPDVLRVRPYVVTLRSATPPNELRLATTDARGTTSFAHIPSSRIPGAPAARQRRRISLLERPPDPRDARAAAELRSEGKSREVAATARVAFEFEGRMVFAYREGDEVCLVGFGTGCAPEWSAVSDEPLGGAMRSVTEEISYVGLLHDGPDSVTVERRDGSTFTVPVRNNVYAFEDRDVARLRWDGLDGPVTQEMAP